MDITAAGMEADTVVKLDGNETITRHRDVEAIVEAKPHTDGPLELAEPSSLSEIVSAKLDSPIALENARATTKDSAVNGATQSDRAAATTSIQAAEPKPVKLAKVSTEKQAVKAKKIVANPKVQPTNYKTLRTVPLREMPRFGSTNVATLNRGNILTVVDIKGAWLKVETASNGKTGYVRKEYVTPIKAAN